jgi:hypothetical protein
MPSTYAGLAPGYHPAHHRTTYAPPWGTSGPKRRHMSGATTIPTDQSCPNNQLVDAITLGCAPMCPDDSRPVNGKCVGYSGAPVGPGYMIIAGKAIPKWAVYAAGGIAALLVITLGWHLLSPKSAKVAAKAAASFFR